MLDLQACLQTQKFQVRRCGGGGVEKMSSERNLGSLVCDKEDDLCFWQNIYFHRADTGLILDVN